MQSKPQQVGEDESKEIKVPEVLDASELEQQQQQKQERAAKARMMMPMSKEEHEAKQSIVREVHDPETGRTRLVRGDGEIIERIVSRVEHAAINRQATRGDGASFIRGIHQAQRSNF